MQHDEVIWQTINQHFCCFKVKTKTQNFCRNKDNVTGLCNRSSCPLANSRYATIHEEKGVCYLYIKTIERAHTPLNMWEKIKLSRNYATALKTIDEQLAHWPNFLIHKNKQRLTKIHQYLIRMRKLKLNQKEEIVTVNKKKERQQRGRENKALKAAHITDSIKQELLQRLSQGTYGDIYNFPAEEYKEVLDDMDQENEDLQEVDEDDEEEMPREFVEAYNDSDEDIEDGGLPALDQSGSDREDADESDEDKHNDDNGRDDDEASDHPLPAPVLPPKRKRPDSKPSKKASSKDAKQNQQKKQKKGGRSRVEVEYEHEHESAPAEQVEEFN